MAEGSGPVPVSQRDARHTRSGIYSGWLTKEKSDSAKVKWLSGSSRRLFTIDFEARVFYYSRGEGKASSEPVPFSEIVNAELLQEIRRSWKVLGSDGQETAFALRTCEREMRLWSPTYQDASLWVDALEAARHVRDRQAPDWSRNAGVIRELARVGHDGKGDSACAAYPSKRPAQGSSPARSSMSTQEGSDSRPGSGPGSDIGFPSDVDLGAAWIPPGERTNEVSAPTDRGYATSSKKASSDRAGYASLLAEDVDPFAALEAFAEELRPGLDQEQVWTEQGQSAEKDPGEASGDQSAAASVGCRNVESASTAEPASAAIVASEAVSCITPQAQEPSSPNPTSSTPEEKKKSKRKKKLPIEPQESSAADAELSAEDLRRQQQDLALLQRFSPTCGVKSKGQKLPEKIKEAPHPAEFSSREQQDLALLKRHKDP